jgi:DNA-binding NarL/FixJ family response regulator
MISSASPAFTDRELEIIRLCRDGMLGKQIADRLGVSPSTVNKHKEHIFQKLGINSTMEMVQYALNKGIIRVES